MSQEYVYKAAGFGAHVPRGRHPAVIVVDFTYGFTDTQYPTASDMRKQIAAAKRLIDLARSKKFPVIFTTISYNAAERGALPWLKKATGMAALVEGSRLVEVDADTGIQVGDPVVVKKGASAFFGTTLGAMLTGAGRDTVIVVGATTSGCVRATVVDAVQSGFNVLVPADCCADRAQAPHEANLYDMDQKYADVTDSIDLLKWIDELPAKSE